MASMTRSGKSAVAQTADSEIAAGALRVGAALRQAREERGLTLAEVERTIRFAARQLLAVEEGRTGDLPPHPYARGLVVAYATLLGLDAEAAAQEWGRPPGENREGRRSLFRVPLRTRSSWRDWAVPMACAGGTLIAIGLGPVLRPAPAELPEPPPSRQAEQRPVPQPAVEDRNETPAEETPAGLDLGVTLRAEGATWIEVAADGEETRRQELEPGQLLELRARKRLGLALGDAGVVRIAVNGRELGFIGDKGEVRKGIVFEASPKTAVPRDGAAGQ